MIGWLREVHFYRREEEMRIMREDEERRREMLMRGAGGRSGMDQVSSSLYVRHGSGKLKSLSQ